MDLLWDRPGGCPSCSSQSDYVYIVVKAFPGLFVETPISCGNCHYRQPLDAVLEIDAGISIKSYLDLLAEVLRSETDLPVYVEPPDDPDARVREPRRPPPRSDSGSVTLSPDV